MSIKIVEGSLLDTDAQYICHQVNCQGKMNSGVAKAIREKWIGVYELYKTYCRSNSICRDPKSLLGHCQYIDMGVNKKTIVNMFSQENYGYDGKRYTSYDTFWDCLEDIRDSIPKGSSIAFPYNIGCCRGGANWNVIYKMIEEVLGEDYEVEIRRLDRG